MRAWLALLFLSLALSLGTALVAFRRRNDTAAARSFVAIPLFHALWTALEIVGAGVRSVDGKLLINGFEWLAGLGTVAASVWFASEYIGRRFRLELWGWVLLAPVPIILMLLGEPFDHRVHPEAWVRLLPEPASLEYNWGWAEISLITYGCLMSLVACALVVSRFARWPRHNPTELIVVVAGLGLPPAAALVSLALGLRWFSQRDVMPLVFGASDLIVALGLLHRRVFELAPLALETVVAALPDGVVVCDRQGSIVEVNAALSAILPLPKGRVLGTPASVTFAGWGPVLAASAGQRVRAEMELPASSAAGDGVEPARRRWLDVIGTPVHDRRGQPLGAVVVLRDITATKNWAQRRFQAVFDHSFQLIALLDPAGRILEVNETALAFAGARRQQVEGRPLWDAPWWAHSATMREELRAAVQAMAAGEFVRFEAIHLRCDAKMRYFDFSLTSIRKDDGGIEYLIAEGRDVTDLLNAEKENAALAEKLSHARRLEAIGQMAAAVAHDFNNLLVAIMGSVEAVRADLNGHATASRGLQVIEQASESAAKLTRQLLMFGRPQPAAAAPVDVAQIVSRSASLLAPMMAADVAITFHSAPGLWPVRIDPAQLEQVLINLGVNARDAMPGGGSLRITAENVCAIESRRFQDGELRPGDYVKIAVRDTGSGMPEAIVDRIFEPFFTTKAAGRGTGLGLAVAHGVVRGCGGSIEVQSAPGAGTEVSVYLPRAQAAGAAADGVPGLLQALPKVATAARPEVLIIEDERTLRGFVRDQLLACGYQVHAYPDGPTAETCADSLELVPSLLITDFVLAEEAGLSVADGFRRRWPDLKVLFLSGFAATVHQRQGRADVHFLPKPFDAGTLQRTVATILGLPPALSC
ncbi:MAG TPA: PAS domain-containing protein [Polyangia bacterium]|nr:PAS domain-containing protein [Polyangia bacterium]